MSTEGMMPAFASQLIVRNNERMKYIIAGKERNELNEMKKRGVLREIARTRGNKKDDQHTESHSILCASTATFYCVE
jgi:hypothetical protein